jgi:hypothetical protein
MASVRRVTLRLLPATWWQRRLPGSPQLLGARRAAGAAALAARRCARRAPAPCAHLSVDRSAALRGRAAPHCAAPAAPRRLRAARLRAAPQPAARAPHAARVLADG